VARGIAKDETQASVTAFRMLQRRGHPDRPPALISDGWGGIDEAMIEVFGKVPEQSGRGHPFVHKRAQPGWQYLQMVKHRDIHGRFLGIRLRVVFGEPAAVLQLLGKSTAYVERNQLTKRTFNSRLVRKTLAFSKSLQMHEAAAVWEDSFYNLMRFHKGLRQRVEDDPSRHWHLRTPAMAAGLTEHIWTVKDLLWCVPLPAPNCT